MLRCHFANRFESLETRLLDALTSALARGPFAHAEVIVPSVAVQRRITLALAQRRGIAANLRFGFLAQWLWQRSATRLAGVPPQSPLAVPLLTWHAFAAFADDDWVAGLPRLQHWLAQADARSRFGMALRLAQQLDAILTERPQWARDWLRGKRLGLGADEDWQAALWQRVVHAATPGTELALAPELLQTLQALARSQPQHPTRAGGQATPAAARSDIAQTRDCVHVFALPSMPALHLQWLQALSHWVDVELYVLNPCAEYWFDLIDERRLARLAAKGKAAAHEVGHPLLAAWGQATQAHLRQCVECIEAAAPDEGEYVDAGGHSLLARVQDSILRLSPPAAGAWADVAADDRSLEVHCCHSLAREIEVVHNRLVGLFAQQPGLRADEVLVVLPDLQAAAPIVKAVFSGAEPALALPYTLTGLGQAQVNPAASGLLRLLEINDEEAGVSLLSALLAHPMLARRFGLDDDSAQETLQSWWQQAGFHHGLGLAAQGSGEAAALSSPPPPPAVSLAAALERLLLGHALAQQPLRSFMEVRPAGSAHGQRAEVLGGLCRFARALGEWAVQLQQPASAGPWQARLQQLLSDFFAPQGLDETQTLGAVREAIGQALRPAAQACAALPLPLAVVRQALEQALDEPARGGVPTGRITITSMSSLRSLPFRVVCVLGLSDGAYPSAQRPLDFDLLAAHRQSGDRHRGSEERNVFLDLLLAARSHLHLSYCGRSQRDSVHRPPSVLLSQLLEFVLPALVPVAPGERHEAPDRTAAWRRVHVEQPMQAFALELVREGSDPRIRSHDETLAAAWQEALRLRAQAREDAAAATATATASTPTEGADDEALEEADDTDAANGGEARPRGPDRSAPPLLASPLSRQEHGTVTLVQLRRFFRHPARAFLQQRLGLRADGQDDALSDAEPMHAHRGLVARLAEHWLQCAIDTGNEAQAWALACQHPAWPPGALGKAALQAEWPALWQLGQRVRRALVAQRPVPQAIDLLLPLSDGGSCRLQGQVLVRPQGETLFWNARERDGRDALDVWLQHLAAAAHAQRRAGAAQPSVWWQPKADDRFAVPDDANKLLGQLLDLYMLGQRSVLPYYPKAAWAWLAPPEGASGRSLDAARTKWHGGRELAWAESDDPAWRLTLRGQRAALDDHFQATARAVLEPLIQHLGPDAETAGRP
jgi:exodeoxyribonuclease V gamma subunit